MNPKLFTLASFLVAALASPFLSAGQDPNAVKTSIRKMAEEKGYGILYCQAGTTALTSMTNSFAGMIEIEITSTRLDTLMSKKELQTEAGQKALMDIAQQLVRKGVEFRKNGDNQLSLLCYRLPLLATCAANEINGMRIISLNAWYATESLKGAMPKTKETEAVQLFAYDAKYLLGKYQSTWENFLKERTNWNTSIFHTYHRIALFARDKALSTSIVLNALQTPDKAYNKDYTIGLIEELANTQTWEILQQTVSDENARKETEPFKKLWAYYLKYSPEIMSNPKEYSTPLNYCLKQFETLRASVTSAGGSFGHKLSYIVSGYLQVIGRDLALVDALNGNTLYALEDAERVRGRSLGDWIARSHASTRLERQSIIDQNAAQPYFMSLKIASLQEIAAASRENDANILIYLSTMKGYLVWLIKPDGNYYTSLIPDGDTLVKQLMSTLPYDIAANTGSRSITMKSRSVIKSPVQKPGASTDAVLSRMYSELLPDSIGIAVSASAGKKLIVIPDGMLNYVPFNALKTTRNKYLIEDAVISYWPSVSSWLLIKDSEKVFAINNKKDTATDPIQILGNPVFKGKYPTTVNGAESQVTLSELPGTAKEIDAIAGMFQTKFLQQEQVTTSSFLQRKKVNIVHLATHGYMNTENGMKSFVAFADGPLYAENLYEDAGILKCRMVVLSACQTGLGYLADDSPIGLTTSFFVGGANSVVSTLWSIDDEASSALMVEFYKQIKEGKDIATALRNAQLQLLQQPKWAAPMYWAAFKQAGVDTNPLKE